MTRHSMTGSTQSARLITEGYNATDMRADRSTILHTQTTTAHASTSNATNGVARTSRNSFTRYVRSHLTHGRNSCSQSRKV